MWCIPLGDGVTLKHLSLQIFSWKRSKEWLTSGTCLHLTWFTQTHIYLHTDKNKHPNTHTYCIQMACAHTITDTLMSSSTELQSPTAEVHVIYLLTQIAPDSSIDPALFFFFIAFGTRWRPNLGRTLHCYSPQSNQRQPIPACPGDQSGWAESVCLTYLVVPISNSFPLSPKALTYFGPNSPRILILFAFSIVMYY